MGFSGVSIDTVKPREYVSPIDVASFERTVEHNIANEDKQAALVAGVAGQAIGRYKQDIDNLLSNYSSLTGSNSIAKISNFMANPEVKQVMNGIIDSTTLANEIQKYQDTGNAIPLDLQAAYKPYSDYINGRTSTPPKDRPTYSAPFLDYNKAIKDVVATVPEEMYTLQPGEYGNDTGKPFTVTGKDPRKIADAIKLSGIGDFVYRQQSALARHNGDNRPDNERLSEMKFEEEKAKTIQALRGQGKSQSDIDATIASLKPKPIEASPFVSDELAKRYMDAEAQRYASLYMSAKKEGYDVGDNIRLAQQIEENRLSRQQQMQIAFMNDSRQREANDLRREEVKSSKSSDESFRMLKDAQDRAEYLVDKIDADARAGNADQLKVALKMYGQYNPKQGLPSDVRKAKIDEFKHSIYDDNMRTIHPERYEEKSKSSSPPPGTGAIGSTGITSTGGITVAGIPSK